MAAELKTTGTQTQLKKVALFFHSSIFSTKSLLCHWEMMHRTRRSGQRARDLLLLLLLHRRCFATHTGTSNRKRDGQVSQQVSGCPSNGTKGSSPRSRGARPRPQAAAPLCAEPSPTSSSIHRSQNIRHRASGAGCGTAPWWGLCKNLHK